MGSSSCGSAGAEQDERMISEQLDEMNEPLDWWPTGLSLHTPNMSHLLGLEQDLAPIPCCDPMRVQSEGSLAHATSFQSLNLERVGTGSECTDSPRSLDHYQGFGANYSRNCSQARQQHMEQRQPELEYLASANYNSVETYCLEPQTIAPPPDQSTPQHLRFAEPEVVQVAPPPPVRRLSTASSCEPAAQARPDPGLRPVEDSHRATRLRRGQRARVDEESGAELDQILEGQAQGTADQQSSSTDADKWSDSDADAIVRGARETAQMALSMYQFTRGEGDLNTTQDLFTQAELFAEEANELYKEVRCFSYKVSRTSVRLTLNGPEDKLIDLQIAN